MWLALLSPVVLFVSMATFDGAGVRRRFIRVPPETSHTAGELSGRMKCVCHQSRTRIGDDDAPGQQTSQRDGRL